MGLTSGSVVTTLIVINAVIFFLMRFSPTLREMIYEWGAMQTRAVLHGHIWRLFIAHHTPNTNPAK